MKIIENPPQGWVRNLREGCEVWQTKQKTVATVVAPFTPSMRLGSTGRLFIRQFGHGIDYWFVSENGKGIDGSTILEPIEGSLPDTPALLQSSEAEELKLEIARLRAEVQALSRMVLNPFMSLLQNATVVRIPLNSEEPAELEEDDEETDA